MLTVSYRGPSFVDTSEAPMTDPEEQQPSDATDFDPWQGEGDVGFTFADGDEPQYDPERGFGSVNDPTVGGKLGWSRGNGER